MRPGRTNRSVVLLLLFLYAPLVAGRSAQVHLSSDLEPFLAGRDARSTVRVIAHGSHDENGDPADLVAAASRHGARLHKVLTGGVVLDVTRGQLAALALDRAFEHVSGDLEVQSTLTITNKSTAADQARAATTGLLGLLSSPGVTGKGIGVAVIDSGITPHQMLGARVVANVSMLGSSNTRDEFGHGTHVAGIIAGASTSTSGLTTYYTSGIAPGANLINVRVLGANGGGMVSDVIEGIDWVIANKSRFNIRVMNLSLGHTVTEPSATDPLCEAVERAFEAGIVVVASAGNYGRTSDGHRVLGGITSPGNSPYAITVGAVDTKGTVSRSDDEVAAYSSRGPTKFDFAVKPDLVAPGTHVVSLEASNSYLASNGYETHIWGSGSNAYGRLSGTSMSAAAVSGGVALLLEANPNLDPTRVKVALQAGSTFIRDGGLIGAGAGSVDFKISKQIATDGLVINLPTISIAGITVTASGVSFRDHGTLIDNLYNGTGLQLVDPILATLLWASPSAIQSGKLYLLGLTNPLALLTPKQLVWGEVGYWTTSEYIVWGNSIQDPDGDYIVWGNSDGDYIVWGNSAGGGRRPE